MKKRRAKAPVRCWRALVWMRNMCWAAKMPWSGLKRGTDCSSPLLFWIGRCLAWTVWRRRRIFAGQRAARYRLSSSPHTIGRISSRRHWTPGWMPLLENRCLSHVWCGCLRMCWGVIRTKIKKKFQRLIRSDRKTFRAEGFFWWRITRLTLKWQRSF